MEYGSRKTRGVEAFSLVQSLLCDLFCAILEVMYGNGGGFGFGYGGYLFCAITGTDHGGYRFEKVTEISKN